METIRTEWTSAEATTDGPSLDFIRAVAQLLEIESDDILSELGYSPTAAIAQSASDV